MSHRDRQILGKLLAEIRVVYDMLDHYDEARFLADERTIRAVCMTLINIGELVKNLSDEIKQANPSVPWRAISGMRDIAAHQYQTLKMADVYTTCEKDIPIFETALLSIMQKT